jgi:hypothetical protein
MPKSHAGVRQGPTGSQVAANFFLSINACGRQEESTQNRERAGLAQNHAGARLVVDAKSRAPVFNIQPRNFGEVTVRGNDGAIPQGAGNGGNLHVDLRARERPAAETCNRK